MDKETQQGIEKDKEKITYSFTSQKNCVNIFVSILLAFFFYSFFTVFLLVLCIQNYILSKNFFSFFL